MNGPNYEKDQNYIIITLQTTEPDVDSDGDCIELNVHNENHNDHDYTLVDHWLARDREKRALASKTSEVSKLKKKNTLLKNKCDSMMAGNLPKSVQKRTVEVVLNGKFTGKQIQQFNKPKKTEGTVYILGQ